ncbi:MAG: trypsin-like peptidase domain-containing protein [Propionibacteriaceae bacterium]|jgi:S1-C subfamily serine protease|nr:trypsin-like peptidase domain-containing protein [Propionibacteriaceae bacterium]
MTDEQHGPTEPTQPPQTAAPLGTGPAFPSAADHWKTNPATGSLGSAHNAPTFIAPPQTIPAAPAPPTYAAYLNSQAPQTPAPLDQTQPIGQTPAIDQTQQIPLGQTQQIPATPHYYVGGPAGYPQAQPYAAATGYTQPQQAYSPPQANYPPPQSPDYYAGQPYAYTRYAYAPPAAPVAPPKKKSHPVRNVLAIALAFALGMGCFAVGGRFVSSILPQAETTPKVIEPYYPDDEEQGGWDTEPVQPTQPRNADTSVTADQSRGIVLITGLSDGAQSSGTGMVLSSDGKVLTNYHVVAGTTELQVTVVDTNAVYTAKVLGFDQEQDVSLLQLQDASGLATVTIDYDTLNISDSVSVVGNANGGGVLVRADGTVTAKDQDLTVSSDSPWGAEEDLEGLIQTNANAEPGDSGGPMFDAEGEVTGMTTAGSERQSISYAIPIQNALKVVAVIEAGRDQGTTRVGPAGYMGVSFTETNNHRRRGGSSTGRMIAQVVSGSPADQVGIVQGSTLLTVDGQSLYSDTNPATIIRALEPGQTVSVTWIDPYGEQHTANMTLAESPVN